MSQPTSCAAGVVLDYGTLGLENTASHCLQDGSCRSGDPNPLCGEANAVPGSVFTSGAWLRHASCSLVKGKGGNRSSCLQDNECSSAKEKLTMYAETGYAYMSVI